LETRAADVANGVFDPWLVGRPPYSSGVNCEAAGLGIVQECQVEPGRQGIGLDYYRGQVVRDHDAEDAAEVGPGMLEAFNDGGQRLLETQPAEHVPAEDRCEDEAPRQSSALAEQVEHQAHPAVVHLHLLTRFAVSYAYGGVVHAEAELGNAEPMQRAVRHGQPPPPEQDVDLGQRQVLLKAVPQERPLALQLLPAPATTRRTSRSQGQEHGTHRSLGQLRLAPIRNQAGRLSRGYIASNRLPVDPSQTRGLTYPLASQPEP